MTKEVLVLCQRKSGKSSSAAYEGDVKNIVVPKINKLVQEHLGSDAHIEYLTKMSTNEGESDYNFSLDSYPNNNQAKEFIANHRGFYSLIILNTCPFKYIDFKLIHNLLEPEGIMMFTVFPDIVDKNIITKDILNIEDLFENIGPNIYRKKQVGGKKGKVIGKCFKKTYRRKIYRRKTYKKRKSFGRR
jgi:hypothetical protein